MEARLTILVFDIAMTSCFHVVQGTGKVGFEFMVTHLATPVKANVSDVERGAVQMAALLGSIYVSST